jgi:hypothetical protein
MASIECVRSDLLMFGVTVRGDQRELLDGGRHNPTIACDEMCFIGARRWVYTRVDSRRLSEVKAKLAIKNQS